ncbi:MAG: EAL domain-containing protein [Acidimicrobiia bacterium]|nr:EAL domain-containing protein [Acidimicrobiia bacterium]
MLAQSPTRAVGGRFARIGVAVCTTAVAAALLGYTLSATVGAEATHTPLRSGLDSALAVLGASCALVALTWWRTRRSVGAARDRRFEAIVRNAHEAVALCDQRGRVTYLSAASRDIFGIDGVGASISELARRYVHPDDVDAVFAAYRSVLDRPGATTTSLARWHRPDGRVVAVESSYSNLLREGDVRALVVSSRDVSDRVALESELSEIIDSAPLAIVELDLDSRVRRWNPAAERLFGWRSAEVVGGLVPYVPDSDRRPTDELMARILAGDAEANLELVRQHRSGRPVPVTASIARRMDAAGPVGTIAFFSDATERSRLVSDLYRQAFHDPLTGLGNRALFHQRLVEALERRRARGGSVAVLFLDLDDFKTINDSLGHDAGDTLVRHVGRRLLDRLRTDDLAARIGGDEFAILLERVPPSGVERVVQAITGELRRPFELHGREVYVHCSIGVAIATRDENAEEVLRNADLAMYEAKKDGKARYRFFEPAMHQAALRRLDLKASLRRAIERDDLVVHYQPIVSLRTGNTVACEALVRWRRDGELVAPSEFVPLAEETGLINALGRVVVQRTCSDARRLMERVPALRWVSVNLSPTQLLQDTLAADISLALEDSGLAADQLLLEITEDMLIEDLGVVRRRLDQLRELGVRLAMDDFGTGYSSLWCLQHLPLDIIKLDRAFTEALTLEPANRTIARHVIDLARSLDLEVIAEGIERPAEAQILRDLGCRLGQGFLYARARPIESFGVPAPTVELDVPRPGPGPGEGSTPIPLDVVSMIRR